MMKLPPIKPAAGAPIQEKANAHRLHDFYTVHRTADGKFKEIAINKVKFVSKLMALGFRRYDLTVTDSKYIRLENNTIEEVSEKTITDAFLKYVEDLPDYEHPNDQDTITITPEIIKGKLYNALEMYFKSALFNRMLNPVPIHIKADTKNEKYFFFRNVWVIVSASGYIVKDYGELDGYIWKNQILPREFHAQEKPLSYFEVFCTNITGNNPERLLSLKTLLGYNLHSFYQGKLKATILTDSRISNDGEANGRTGKGILCKALGHMLNADIKKSTVYVAVNGRDYNPKNVHKHADCNLDTSLLHIEDIYDNYNIENSFNDITDGLTVRKLFQGAFMISVKIIFSTNKTIVIEGESAKDRVYQFELSDYYNSNFDPSQEFKHWFFDDWKPEEWARFDVFMFECCRLYLFQGVKEAPPINLHIRTLRDHTAPEFISYMNDLMKGEVINYRISDTSDFEEKISISAGEQINKRLLFEAFIRTNKDYNNNRFKQKTFTRWVRHYCSAQGLKMDEGRANSKDYFIFSNLTK